MTALLIAVLSLGALLAAAAGAAILIIPLGDLIMLFTPVSSGSAR